MKAKRYTRHSVTVRFTTTIADRFLQAPQRLRAGEIATRTTLGLGYYYAAERRRRLGAAAK